MMRVGVSSIDNYRAGKRQPRALELMRLFNARDEILRRLRSDARAEINRASIALAPTSEDLAAMKGLYGEDAGEALFSAYNAHALERRPLVGSFDPDDTEVGVGWSSGNWNPATKGALPEIDVRLGAGEGSVGEMVSIPSNGGFAGHKVIAEWVFPNTFLASILGADAARCIVQEVVGDSMSPTYQPGDRVIVDLSQTRLTTDTVYAISDGEAEPQIKRLQRVPFSDPPMVKIISDNPNLETFDAFLERVHIIGRIIGVVARR